MSIVNGPKISTMVSAANGDTYGDGDRHELRTQQGLIMPNVISMLLSAAPGSPANGNTYVVGASPTGWIPTGQTVAANDIAYWAMDPQDGPSISPTITTGAWEFYAPLAGWAVFDNATGLTWKFNGTSWNFTRIASTAAFAAGTTVAVPFPVTYTGTQATGPVVTVTALNADPSSAGGIWTTPTGSAGAWTGFTLHATNTNSLTFNYVVEG